MTFYAHNSKERKVTNYSDAQSGYFLNTHFTHTCCFRSSYPNDVDSDCVAQDFTTGEWSVHRCGSVDLNYICKTRKSKSMFLELALFY